MNVNKIYIYGCSFSVNFWIGEENIYPNLLSKHFNVEYINRADSATCHNEAYLRLTNDLKNFEKDDLIVYQFTSSDREGYMVNDDSLYFTTAALTKDLKRFAWILDRWGKGRTTYKVSDKQLEILLDYMDGWVCYTKFHKFNRVVNTLEFLKNKVGVNYCLLFLDDGFEKYKNPNKIVFPIKKNKNNNSILDWGVENKFTLGDSRPNEVPYDNHPDEKGHYGIFENIIKKIDETN